MIWPLNTLAPLASLISMLCGRPGRCCRTRARTPGLQTPPDGQCRIGRSGPRCAAPRRRWPSWRLHRARPKLPERPIRPERSRTGPWSWRRRKWTLEARSCSWGPYVGVAPGRFRRRCSSRSQRHADRSAWPPSRHARGLVASRAAASSLKLSRSCGRARRVLVLTVPTGQPKRAAISGWERSPR
jgi:hypothetical protein